MPFLCRREISNYGFYCSGSFIWLGLFYGRIALSIISLAEAADPASRNCARGSDIDIKSLKITCSERDSRKLAVVAMDYNTKES